MIIQCPFWEHGVTRYVSGDIVGDGRMASALQVQLIPMQLPGCSWAKKPHGERCSFSCFELMSSNTRGHCKTEQ